MLTELIKMVDDGKIAFRPAVELSYLTEVEQRWLHEAMEYADATPSLAQAIKLKAFSQDKTLGPRVTVAKKEGSEKCEAKFLCCPCTNPH